MIKLISSVWLLSCNEKKNKDNKDKIDKYEIKIKKKIVFDCGV